MKPILHIFLLLFSTGIIAQNTYQLKGKIIDKDTKEPLVGVSVALEEYPKIGTFSDPNGDYDLSIPKGLGKVSVRFNLIGYISEKQTLSSEEKRELNIGLEETMVSLNAVEVTGIKKDNNIKDVQSGVQRLEIETINKIPVLLGEKDIMKTILLLPGIQSAGEGNTGFYVRGGSDDQNLVLLDNATVYNPSHLFGFFSTFNSDAVNDMTIYKGSMPAQYGGRLSSALDVGMRDGDLKKYGVTGGIGLISSRLTVEGPLQKEKSSFIVSARRTYADVIAKAMGVKQIQKSSLYFYDLNAKLSYVISDRDKLTLTAYHGRDKLGMEGMMNTNWGNTLAALKWNHTFSGRSMSATSLSYTKYSYGAEMEMAYDIKVKAHIQDYNLNQEFTFFPNRKNTIKLGFNSIYHEIVPGEATSEDESSFELTPYKHRKSWENAIFASHNVKLTDELELNYGLRSSAFSVLGGADYYTFDNNQSVVDTLTTKSGEFVKTYLNLEPRVSLAYQLNENSSLKAAYARTVQNIHMLATSPQTRTFDRWTGSTNYIKPETADQVSLGYFRNFDDDNYEFSAEIYYKKLGNQIDYKDGADILGDDNFETELLFGKGRAFGMELFLKKKFGRLNGWVGYTLSRSEKKIDKINNNEWYRAIQDRTHDISIVGMYDLSKKWSLSAAWVYATGSPITHPSAKYTVGEQTVYYIDGRNKYRTPAFHRLDLGATLTLKKTKTRLSELAFGLYNAYGRQNPYMYDIRQNAEDPTKTETYKIYLFSVVPSITWNFKF